MCPKSSVSHSSCIFGKAFVRHQFLKIQCDYVLCKTYLGLRKVLWADVCPASQENKARKQQSSWRELYQTVVKLGTAFASSNQRTASLCFWDHKVSAYFQTSVHANCRGGLNRGEGAEGVLTAVPCGILLPAVQICLALALPVLCFVQDVVSVHWKVS